eukprot:symbB.v1.2.029928.t1/scaffold3272.1/size142108/8
MAPAIGEEVAPPVEKKAAPRPYSQQLLITESLRWAPTLTTRHWQPQQSHFDAAAKRFQLADDDPKPLADDGMSSKVGAPHSFLAAVDEGAEEQADDRHVNLSL